MPEKIAIDTNIVGIDNDFSGTDACCINSLKDQEATPNGIGVVCDICGDAWVSQIKEDGGTVWFRTFAGRYPVAVRAKIVIASIREHKIKRTIVLLLVALVLVIIGWNIGQYWNRDNALGHVVFNSSAVVLVTIAASVALFGSLFRRFSRNSKKLRFEAPALDSVSEEQNHEI